MSTNKRVCIIDKVDSRIMRTTREFAVASTTINSDRYKYVPKKKLKKAVKDHKKELRRQESIKRLNNRFKK